MNPNFKHIVKKLTLGSHKGGSPFPKTDWDKLYKKRDMNLYGDLSPSEFKAESERQIGGGKVPTSKMKGSGSKKSGKDWTKTFLDMNQPASDRIAKKQRQSKIDQEIADVTKKHYKNEAVKKAKEAADKKAKEAKEAFDNKTIKDHRADKRATRDKFRKSKKSDTDFKLEKIRSLGESKRGIRNIKENKKVAKLAARKGISEDDAKKLRSERKQKGRDFWRNFASQVTRGVNVAGKGNFDANKSNTDFRK